MNPMEIKLYKAQIIRGKDDIAREWMRFLDANKEEGARLLKNEQAYLEVYFSAVEDGTMFIYMFFAAKDIAGSNAIAKGSENPTDKKHFEYASRCVEPNKGDIMDCLFYMENLEDVGKY
ncbi:MAG: DUF6176 family protein [Peptococcaceae bacterium]|jgi:ssDNA-specific exonuclease RecJ|nr:DUF6176 family protein [Peptococcaceae bacterium]